MGFVGICRDVTLRRQLEEEQIKGQKLESLGTLAGGIAHDFNNILTGILGNISLANMSTDDPTIKDLLGEAENASLEARDLVCKLLTFAKGGVPIKEKLTVEEFVRESVRFALSGTSIDVSYNFSADLPPLAADRTQLDQVIQNIVINAVQAMRMAAKLTLKSIRSVRWQICPRRRICMSASGSVIAESVFLPKI
jgi:signal transduction histidine kinase